VVGLTALALFAQRFMNAASVDRQDFVSDFVDRLYAVPFVSQPRGFLEVENSFEENSLNIRCAGWRNGRIPCRFEV